MSRSRSFSFTWNNYDDDSEKYLRSLATKYVVFGKEIAPSTGTPHLQGMVVWPQPKTLAACIKSLPGCHVESAIVESALLKYVIKDGDVTEWGTRPMLKAQKGEAGKAVYEEAYNLALAGRFEDIPEPLRTRFYSTYRRIAVDHLITPPDLDVLENLWIYGPSGCGKSRGVRQKYPDAYNKDPKTRWWDGYSGQETVVIDDLDVYDKAIGGDLKRWVDHYPFPAQMKGSSVVIRPKRVIVTSQYAPEEIWEDPKTLEALRRRFVVSGPPLEPFVAGFMP